MMPQNAEMVRRNGDGMATKWRLRTTTDRQDRIIFVYRCDFYLKIIISIGGIDLYNKN